MVGEQNLIWRRSPNCQSDCVEVAITDDCVFMRNSRSPDGPWLTFSLVEWGAFLSGLREPPDPVLE
jgi:Domain of unknown function (DUF397)